MESVSTFVIAISVPPTVLTLCCLSVLLIEFYDFFQDCRHFTMSVLSAKTVKDLTTTIMQTYRDLYESLNNSTHRSVLTNAQTVVKQITSWLYSVNAFYNKTKTSYAEAFPELAKPLLHSISQILYSFTQTIDLIKELIVKIEQGPIWEQVKDLIEYPIAIPNRENAEEYLNRFVNAKFSSLLRRNVIAGGDDGFSAEIQCLE